MLQTRRASTVCTASTLSVACRLLLSPDSASSPLLLLSRLNRQHTRRTSPPIRQTASSSSISFQEHHPLSAFCLERTPTILVSTTRNYRPSLALQHWKTEVAGPPRNPHASSNRPRTQLCRRLEECRHIQKWGVAPMTVEASAETSPILLPRRHPHMEAVPPMAHCRLPVTVTATAMVAATAGASVTARVMTIVMAARSLLTTSSMGLSSMGGPRLISYARELSSARKFRPS